MNLTILEKIITIFKYTFSSFLSIELLLVSALLFVILIINLERKQKIITYIAIAIYIGILLGFMIAYNTYVILCFKAFLKLIVTYICFPTTVAFFSTMVFISMMMIYTLFSRKLSKFKKIVNYLFLSILYFFFMSFVALVAYNKIDLSSTVSLYSNNYVLVIVQASNVLLLIWFIFTFFYRLYNFYKERFD